MKSKREKLNDRLECLIHYTFKTMEMLSTGQIDADEAEKMLAYVDAQHSEIEAELAVLELLENVSLN